MFNEALKQQSTIDYALCSNVSKLIKFDVIDPAINLSDHLPLLIVYTFDMPNSNTNVDFKVLPKDEPQITRFRWDQSNLSLYNSASGDFLQNLLPNIDNAISTDGASNSFSHSYDSSNSSFDIYNFIDTMYDSIVSGLSSCADSFITKHKKSFFKFWWDQELNLLKENQSTRTKFGKQLESRTQILFTHKKIE